MNLLAILTHTPAYVFVLFAALLWLGVSQLFTRKVKLLRVAIMGLGMAGLSLYGALSAFPGQLLTLPVWLAVAAVTFFVVQRMPLPAGTQYDGWQQRFTVPGSKVPLALIMAVFFTKYVVGVAMVMQPTLTHDTTAALVISALYGLFSGMFAGRSMRLGKLALRAERSGANMASA
ncbi:DUF6622 family protein [Variovorax sp. VNK109]|jgi:hypothetical protein|uniref:DUF6622 family protein n=1 Tax=Variovorax sp. VNK109 TaxID=3400919 RepID=UPI003C0155F0